MCKLWSEQPRLNSKSCVLLQGDSTRAAPGRPGGFKPDQSELLGGRQPEPGVLDRSGDARHVRGAPGHYHGGAMSQFASDLSQQMLVAQRQEILPQLLEEGGRIRPQTTPG